MSEHSAAPLRFSDLAVLAQLVAPGLNPGSIDPSIERCLRELGCATGTAGLLGPTARGAALIDEMSQARYAEILRDQAGSVPDKG